MQQGQAVPEKTRRENFNDQNNLEYTQEYIEQNQILSNFERIKKYLKGIGAAKTQQTKSDCQHTDKLLHDC